MGNETNSPKFGSQFKEALAYASDLHAFQYRKGTNTPYITHLLAVASLVGECQGSEAEVIAALLHDAVEDQGGEDTLTEINRKFGETVADIVLGCSDTVITPKPPWKERKLSYIQHLRACNNRSILLISCADKLHNLRTIVADFHEIGEAVWSRFSASKEETLWYYKELCLVYQTKQAPSRLVRELAQLLAVF